MPTTSLEPKLEPGVSDVLRRHNAEAAFETACDIARSCFPAMRALQVELLDDPDEDRKVWVLLHVVMPESGRTEALEAERLRFHEAMVTRVPLELNPLFGLFVSFVPE